MFYRYISLLFISTFVISCDAGIMGDLNENKPPRTSLTIDEVRLPEGERLNSQISISWWGDDPDGYIVGYEFFIGENYQNSNEQWIFTTRTDSTFVLPIEEGNRDADVRFTVRAIDNDGAKDPEPPSIVFPIRNSPPNVSFVATETPPDTTYRVFSFGFRANDPDGFSNLNRIEFAINDTLSSNSWKALEPTTQLLTLRVDDTIPNPVATVFTGRSAISSDITINTINIDGENTFYIRSFDNAGAVSQTISYTWFIKKQTSRILFLNDYAGPGTQTAANLHLGILSDIGISQVDYLNISDGLTIAGRRVPLTQAFPNRSLAAPTINKMLAEWDHIYWISDNLDRNIGYAFELTLEFFERGGTMFINIPTKILFEDNVLLQFLPFQRVQTVPQGQSTFIVANQALLIPTSEVNNPPVLRFRRNLLASFPVIPLGETIELFEAPFRVRNAIGITSDYNGPKVISAMNPDQSILYFGIELSEFTADSDLDRLVEFVCVETLGFRQ
jgi:hypothetical protein